MCPVAPDQRTGCQKGGLDIVQRLNQIGVPTRREAGLGEFTRRVDPIVIAQHQIRAITLRRRVQRGVQQREGIRIEHGPGTREHQMTAAPKSVHARIAQNIQMRERWFEKQAPVTGKILGLRNVALGLPHDQHFDVSKGLLQQGAQRCGNLRACVVRAEVPTPQPRSDCSKAPRTGQILQVAAPREAAARTSNRGLLNRALFVLTHACRSCACGTQIVLIASERRRGLGSSLRRVPHTLESENICRTRESYSLSPDRFLGNNLWALSQPRYHPRRSLLCPTVGTRSLERPSQRSRQTPVDRRKE